MTKPIALAADHGGFELKEAVKAHLDELGLEYIDFGTHSTASVDYPDTVSYTHLTLPTNSRV